MDYSSLISALAQLIVVVASIVITRYAVPYLKTKYGNEKVQNIYGYVKMAVEAAEKKFQESGMGVEKKAYVLAYLKEKGFDISDADLEIFVESAVKILDILDKEIETTEVA